MLKHCAVFYFQLSFHFSLCRILRIINHLVRMRWKLLSRNFRLWHNKKVIIYKWSGYLMINIFDDLLKTRSFFFVPSLEYSRIQSAFLLCKTPSSDKDIHQLNGFLRNAFTYLAMLDYPYETSFMSKMPAFPVKVQHSHSFLQRFLNCSKRSCIPRLIIHSGVLKTAQHDSFPLSASQTWFCSKLKGKLKITM